MELFTEIISKYDVLIYFFIFIDKRMDREE